MRSIFWFVSGFVTALLLALGTGLILLKTTAHGFRANQPPTAPEVWAAHEARTLAMDREAKQRTNPVSNTPEVLAEARAHWADHCAVCHGNDGKGQSEMGEHLYPPAPDMTKRETQGMTDGELFSIIQNGIRFSGMPAWGSEHGGEEDSWKLVRFIRHLPRLSASEIREMEKFNPKSPQELAEEQQEEQFLTGQPSPSPAQAHHHH